MFEQRLLESNDNSPIDLSALTGKVTVLVSCKCGSKKPLKVASILRTIDRVGYYRCLSCGMTEKHNDPAYKESHSKGIVKSWTKEKREKQSQISTALWSDPEFVEKQTAISNQIWSDPEKRKQASEMVLGLWQNPEYRARFEAIWNDPAEKERRSERASVLWQDPEYIEKQRLFKANPEHRLLQSELAVQRWNNSEYRSAIVESQKLIWLDPAMHELMSERVKELWKDPEYIEKQKKAAVDPELCRIKTENAKRQWADPETRMIIISEIKGLWKDLEYIEKQRKAAINPEFIKIRSKNTKHQWQDPKIRVKIIDGIKEVWKDPERREKASLISKQKWQDPVFREKQAIARSNILLSGKDSILERTAQIVLDALGIPYIRHHVIGYFEFDLFIPSHNLLIECQGEYWHSLRKSNDAAKFTYINEYFPEYKVMYLWERDFLNPRLIKQKLIYELLGEDSPIEQIDFSFENVSIKKLDMKKLEHNSYYSAPEEFLQSFHYAGYGRSAKTVYGAYLNDVLIGVCKFAPPMRAESATSMGLIQSQILELDRFCLHPQYQKKNFASWLISRCAKLVFSEFKIIVAFLSYADSTFGHFGTIYKAANWKMLHVVKPDYHYVSPEGFVIHKKTLYDHAKKNSKSEPEYATEFGYLKVFGKSKTKFALYR